VKWICAVIAWGLYWFIRQFTKAAPFRRPSLYRCSIPQFCKGEKVKCILQHAMKAQRENRGTVILFLNLGTKWKWVFNSSPRPLYPLKWHGTHCIGEWVCPRACLDRRGKSFPYWNSIPGPSTQLWVAIPTALFCVLQHACGNFCAVIYFIIAMKILLGTEKVLGLIWNLR
jgi:hypothetical protein